MLSENLSQLIKRQDYEPSAYLVEHIDLTFDLDLIKTRVLNKMKMRRNPNVAAQALRLNGEELSLARFLVNGQGTSFKIEGDVLVLENLPEGQDSFDLEIFTTCNPSKNTKLMGCTSVNPPFLPSVRQRASEESPTHWIARTS